MAYQELTSVANPQTLINDICTFAAANGWTVERNNLVGSARTATIRISGTTDYIHIFNDGSSDVLRHRISIGYDGGLAPSAQPNVTPRDSYCDLRAGPMPKVWMFANGNVLHVVVAISLASTYRMMSFGMLDKIGDYDGGTFSESGFHTQDGYQYYVSPGAHAHFGQSAATGDGAGWLRADCVIDGRTNNFQPFGAYTEGGEDETTGQRMCWTFWPSSAEAKGRIISMADDNTFSGRSIFQPIHVFVRRKGSPAYYSPAGSVPDIRFASLKKFDPEQEVSIGSDVWKIFPGVRKAPQIGPGAGLISASGNLGYAILKVT